MTHKETWRRVAVLAVGVIVATLGATGCGRPPQVTPQNRELIISLATAVSAQNNAWLEANAKLVEARMTEGKLSEPEYKTFSAIIAKAREGDWKTAEAEVYALRDGQEPTAEDFQNLSQRKLDPEHSGLKPPGQKRALKHP